MSTKKTKTPSIDIGISEADRAKHDAAGVPEEKPPQQTPDDASLCHGAPRVAPAGGRARS